MINYDSPVVSLILSLGIDISKLNDISSVGDYISVGLVAVFGIFLLYMFLKFLYKLIISLFRGVL